MKKGFTLIELLVVVLIIGILAAIALPQYQKAVARSKAAGALIMGRAVKDAQERYYLANGSYTQNPDFLDIEYVCPEGFNCVFYPDAVAAGNERKLEIVRTGGGYLFVFSYQFRSMYANVDYCATLKTSREGVMICKTYATESMTAYDMYERFRLN